MRPDGPCRKAGAMSTPPRLAVRAVILKQDRLLIVNAYPGNQSDLWCLPGGGVERGTSLPENLKREVYEETGLQIAVGSMLGVNEFHNPADGFHQVDLYFASTILSGTLSPEWTDPEGVVTQRRFVTQSELAGLRYKPDSLPQMAFSPAGPAIYDPLERLIR